VMVRSYVLVLPAGLGVGNSCIFYRMCPWTFVLVQVLLFRTYIKEGILELFLFFIFLQKGSSTHHIYIRKEETHRCVRGEQVEYYSVKFLLPELRGKLTYNLGPTKLIITESDKLYRDWSSST
jgi:hypothetical protein